MPVLSPAYDNKITRKYSARTVEHKMENKTALQESLGWIEEPKQPIVCIASGMTEQLGGKLLEETIEGLLELPVSIVIRGRGSKKYGEYFTKLASEHSHRVAIVADDEEHLRSMLSGSDIAMFFSEAEGDELENALRYGTIPVSLPNALLQNYNPVQESGNSFVYETPNKWNCFASLVRALETFKFPYDWRTIQKNAMESMERLTNSGEKNA